MLQSLPLRQPFPLKPAGPCSLLAQHDVGEVGPGVRGTPCLCGAFGQHFVSKVGGDREGPWATGREMALEGESVHGSVPCCHCVLCSFSKGTLATQLFVFLPEGTGGTPGFFKG